MARLIDADKISYERAHLIYPDGSECLGYRAVASSVEIKIAPTVDAVEVVRCEKCVLHGNCITEDTFVLAGIENLFCCAGKRKEGAD